MSVTTEKLNETHRRLKEEHGGKQEDYFGPLFLAGKYERPADDFIPNCMPWGHDTGINAWHIDKEARNLYLYRFEWSDDAGSFRDGYRKLIDGGIGRIFGEAPQTGETDAPLARLHLALEEYRDLVNKVFVCFVFNGEPVQAEESAVLESLREELESKKHVMDAFFGRSDVALAIQYISNESRQVPVTSRIRQSFIYDIAFDAQPARRAAKGETMHLGFVTLHDLHRMYADMKHRLFEKNIRAGLSGDPAPNRAIREALKGIAAGKEDPACFVFHHNGITLFAEHFELSAPGTAKIVEPRVLNGAQTITTVARFVEEMKGKPEQAQPASLLKKTAVIAKIITACPQDFITRVTISNNKQNPVEPWNLRANDAIQLEFDDLFRSHGIFYERQENAWEAFAADEEEAEADKLSGKIAMLDLARTFLAAQGETDKISDMRKVFESDSLCEKTFRPSYLKADMRRIVVACKSRLRIGAVLKEIESRGEHKYYFVRHARNLVWALVIQGLFNDEKSARILEDFGGSLSVEAGFNETVKDIGSRRVRPVLSDLAALQKYRGYMERESYGFLRNRAAFADAMALAGKRFGWEMRKLTDNEG